MAGLGNIVTTKLITKGLSCGYPADKGIITSFFGLLYVKITPPPTNQGWHGQGGMIPLRPGEIQNLYKPISDMVPTTIIPKGFEDEYLRKRYTVNIVINGQDSVYQVGDKIGSLAVSVMNLINRTKDKMRVVINNIKTKRLSVKVSNLRKTIFK